MAHTNQTAHYHLPQYVGTDIINPLTDTNGAYEAIDTAIYEVGQTASGMTSDIDALKIQNGDSALDTTAQTLSGAVNELKSGADALGLRVTGGETDISTLQSQMATATGNITTLNTTVAGLQTEVASKASATALNNLTIKVGTGNLNTTAQNCVDAINEVLAEIPSGEGVSADNVTYNNTDSGLTATNAQGAIDEINSKISSLDGADVSYDNTSSGLNATNVQEAVDEIAPKSWTKIDTSSILVSNSSSDEATHVFTELIGAKELVFYINGGVTIYTPVIDETTIKLVANDGSGDNDQYKGWSVITFTKATGSVTYSFRVRGTGISTSSVSCDAIYYR